MMMMMIMMVVTEVMSYGHRKCAVGRPSSVARFLSAPPPLSGVMAKPKGKAKDAKPKAGGGKPPSTSGGGGGGGGGSKRGLTKSKSSKGKKAKGGGKGGKGGRGGKSGSSRDGLTTDPKLLLVTEEARRLRHGGLGLVAPFILMEVRPVVVMTGECIITHQDGVCLPLNHEESSAVRPSWWRT